MALFRRARDDAPPGPEPSGRAAPGSITGDRDPDDSPDALRGRLWALVQFVNQSSGRLPTESVVTAREITDAIRDVIDTNHDGEMDVYAVVAINGIVGDYLPTTLHAYLNLDPTLAEQAGPSGRTPRTALRDQLDALAGAAEELLAATRAHDVDALFTQGNFLRTKFTRSDLDL